MTRILGIDPGAVSGGCAIVLINGGAAPQLVDAIDLPVIGVKAKQRINVLALRSWIQQHKPDHAVIERGQALPRQGASSGFKFGRGCGALEATIQLLEIPTTIVEPSMWKKFYGLRGGDKESGRQRALLTFPAAHALLARKKDHGRAEAALLALYGASRITPVITTQQQLTDAFVGLHRDVMARLDGEVQKPAHAIDHLQSNEGTP